MDCWIERLSLIYSRSNRNRRFRHETAVREQFATTVYPFRVLAIIMGASGVMALLLATIGIYGIVSHSVAQRTREVGIRLALGALKNDILKMVIGQRSRACSQVRCSKPGCCSASARRIR